MQISASGRRFELYWTCMGAAVRLSLQKEDAWLQRVRHAENVVTFAADANFAADEDQIRERRSDNEQIHDAIAQDRARSRFQASTARPTPPGKTRSGRLIRETQGTGSHQNPLDEVLLRTTRAPYLRATDGPTLPIMTLRSGHLPHDYSDNAQATCMSRHTTRSYATLATAYWYQPMCA